MPQSLTYAATVATLAWIAALVLLLVTSRPRSGTAPVRDGWPVDPPALAALLVQPYRTRARTAALATLLDLVARGGLVVEADQPGHAFIRVTGRMPDLHPYERHVWTQVVAGTAQGGGRVPADRIDLGSSQYARGWYTRFTDLLEADGRRLGLVTPRVPLGVRVVLWLSLLAVFGVACAAAIAAHRAPLIGFLLLGYRLVSLPAGRLRRLVPRGAGADAAAACRAARTGLADPAAPGRSPWPAGVGGTGGRPALGDRRTAYAVAVGAIRTDADPFSPTPREVVWSNRDGTWRQLPLAHGRGLMSGASPGSGLASLAGAVPFLGIWAVILGYVTLHLSAERIAEVWPPALIAVGWLLWFALTLFVGRFAGRGIYDLTHPAVEVVGPVVHLESRLGSGDDDPDHFFAAVDDGSGRPAVAYEIDRATHDRLRLDRWLRLVVTPKLGHVRSTEVLAD